MRRPGRDRRHDRWWAAAAGLLAALAALGAGELVTGLVRGTESPVVSVGQVVIDHTPASVKTFAIRTFGERDKDALIAGTGVLLGVLAAVVGVIARRRRRVGAIGAAALGLVGALSARSRPDARVRDVVPSVVGGLVATGVLLVLLRLLEAGAVRRPGAETVAGPANAMTVNRRGFLAGSGVVAASTATLGGIGRSLRHRFDVASARARVQLPAPTSAAPDAASGGAPLDVDGVTSFFTRNDDFYRVDIALVVPQVSPDDWSLRVHGMVDDELRIDYDELLSRPLIERDITLVCVSNEVGGPYAGTARWLGVPLRDVLRDAGVRRGADQLVSRSVDGWTAGSPLAAVLDGRDAMIAVGMNGEPLPVNHGFPARLVVPGLYGYTSATKWLRELEVTTFDAYDPYWVRRGWAKVAPIKTLTRIDTPRGLANLTPGTQMIGGVAWAVHRGISRVEVRVDDGEWRTARLGGAPSADTWRQWALPWDATPGSHTITARAYDGAGELQTEARAEPVPDGASGWHSIVVLVGS